jgi:3-deoxy-D-manno-octulosonic acid kinase
MSPVFMTRIGPYHVGLLEPLTVRHATEIVKMLEQSPRYMEITLGGRRKPAVFDLSNVGSVVIKYFARGGLIRFLIRDHYFRWRETRAQSELVWMEKVRKLGIQAPKPLAFAYKGNRLYTCALITREIKNHRTLAELSRTDLTRVRSLMPTLADQIALLIKHRIHHVDLHPGNVLIDKNDGCWIIDFDKAGIFSGSLAKLRNRYIRRWRRAVHRHGLPEDLQRLFQDALVETIPDMPD